VQAAAQTFYGCPHDGGLLVVRQAGQCAVNRRFWRAFVEIFLGLIVASLYHIKRYWPPLLTHSRLRQ
jgi:hypothetical protein